jgi:hypothetical protein
VKCVQLAYGNFRPGAAYNAKRRLTILALRRRRGFRFNGLTGFAFRSVTRFQNG